ENPARAGGEDHLEGPPPGGRESGARRHCGAEEGGEAEGEAEEQGDQGELVAGAVVGVAGAAEGGVPGMPTGRRQDAPVERDDPVEEGEQAEKGLMAEEAPERGGPAA